MYAYSEYLFTHACVSVYHDLRIVLLFWWPWGNVLFLATPSDSTLRRKGFACVSACVSGMLPNLESYTSASTGVFITIKCASGLPGRAAVSTFVRCICSIPGIGTWILPSINLELLKRLDGRSDRGCRRWCLCRWSIFSQPLADFCIAELFWLLVKKKGNVIHVKGKIWDRDCFYSTQRRYKSVGWTVLLFQNRFKGAK